MLSSLEEKILGYCQEARPESRNTGSEANWTQLLQSNNSKDIWRNTGWSNTIDGATHEAEKPTDEDFKTHFESLLNPAGEELPSSVDPGNVYVPITDDPITPEEVDDAIRTIKPDKSGGPSGISPGVLKLLPTL